MTSLPQLFADDVQSLGASPSTAANWFRVLEERYAREPQRHYHTLHHITAMLACMDAHLSAIVDPLVVRLAIYFHDIVYDPKATGGDNELQSIAVFKDFAQEVNVSPSQADTVCRYIERTITHTLPEGGKSDDIDLRYFLDFDLEVLSRESASYDEYATQIREEYIHYPLAQYRAGRIQVLKNFLLRPRLYFSDSFYASKEERARANISREIKQLSSE